MSRSGSSLVERSSGHSDTDVSKLGLQRVSAREPFFRGFVPTVREIWSFRELLVQLVRKELKVKYKDSVLGFFWSLLRPLMYLVVYSVAIGYFLGNGKVIPDFGIYLFTGLLVWNFFTDIVGGCTGSIVSNGGLIKKVYFPRELFPLAVVGAALINFLLQVVVLVVGYAFTRKWPDIDDLGLVPLALVTLVLFATALGLVLSAVNVYLRDVQYLVEVGLLLWFWMTPIVYDWTKVKTRLADNAPAMRWLYELYMSNPVCNMVLAFQRALWPGGRTERGAAFTYSGDLYLRLGLISLISLGLLWLAQRIFARAQGNFAQEL